MNDTFPQHPGTILREDRLGLFTLTPFLPVHFHWTTTIQNGRIEWQRHALERILERGISRQDVFNVLLTGEEIEDYANDTPFPSALLLGWKSDEPIHVVVALDSSAQQGYIITVYRPDLEHFNPDFRTRRNR